MNYISKITGYLYDRRFTLFYAAVSFLSIFALLSYLRAFALPSWLWFEYSFIDAMLIFVPFWFLKGRWRWTLLICTTLLGLFVIVAIYYARVFHELIPIRMFTLTENFGSLLVKSCFAIVRWTDLLFILLLSVPYVVYFIFRRNIVSEPKFTVLFRWLSVSSSLLMFALLQLYSFFGTYSWFKNELNKSDFCDIFFMKYFHVFDIGQDLRLYQECGFIVHTIFDLYIEISRPDVILNLTKNQNDCISDFIIQNNELITEAANSSILNNRLKNVVFVVVESLNSEVINLKINGNEICPTLNYLIADTTTFSSIKLMPQIKLGNSGDGQLIYNTGLYPLGNLIVSNKLVDVVSFPSLSHSLGRCTNIAILPDDGLCWSQERMLKNVGFDSVITEKYYQDSIAKYGIDGSVFRSALFQINNAKMPFFCEIITGSMHMPFDDHASLDFRKEFDSANISKAVRNYYATVHYFDAELARFIDGLKEMGIWENTILVIASDHDQSIGIGDQEKVKEHNNPIVFILANSGHGGKVDHVVGQVDVFPTVLQLCGHDPSITYTGVGRSMLDGRSGAYDMWSKEVIGTTDTAQIAVLKKSFEISDLIIRGNYFGSK